MTMREKIARAMCETVWAEHGVESEWAKEETPPIYLALAGAALAALEEPTEGMLEEGSEARAYLKDNRYIEGDDGHCWVFGRCDAPPLWGPGRTDGAREWMWREAELAGWRAMIAAAKEG